MLGFIDAGDIAILEIQRPFVWNAKQVRDLIDSLYNGYPTGHLIIWQNPELKNGESTIGKKILIDGQQRVTAIMTAIAGIKILTENYSEKCIRIAFNPLATNGEDRFAVTTPALEKSSFWIPYISEAFKSGFQRWTFMPKYIASNPDADSNVVGEALQRLTSITACQIGTIVLDPSLDISEVTEIFVRINSQGKRLNEFDFSMSKLLPMKYIGETLLERPLIISVILLLIPRFILRWKQRIKSSYSLFMLQSLPGCKLIMTIYMIQTTMICFAFRLCICLTEDGWVS